jgi:CelD/BcsL family acetyltransferase involved in cellulose biosynthesis
MRALKQLRPVNAVDVIDRAAFAAIEEEWNSLVEATRDEPFYRHEYIRSWIDNFVPQAKMKILTGRDDTGKLVAALPLVVHRGSMYGLPVRQLVSPTNVHSFRFDLLAEDVDSAANAFFETLAADDSWDVIRITDVPWGGNAWQIHEAAVHAGFPAGAWESQRSPYIPLPPSGLSPKFQSDLRRRRRRLEEQGKIHMECVTGSAHLQERVEESFAMEESGWKGRQGTAAGQSQSARGFYSELARSAALRHHLSFYFLKLNGNAVAFQYGLTRDGVYSMLRSSYDESLKQLSPGHLLLEEVLKDCCSRGLRELDFLGCDLDWKLEWSKLVRAHHWLFIFRNNYLGRALRTAKFEWIPTLKQRLGRWRTRC